MPWYDDLQCQVEKCVSCENGPLMSELMAEIGVDALVTRSARPGLSRRAAGNIFSRLRHLLFRTSP